MCIAIAKPAGREIPVRFLKESYRSNPHGSGFSVAAKGVVNTFKGVSTWNDFLQTYSSNVKPEDAAIVHFRWATAGEQSARNCHPFQLTHEAAMIHNGTLPHPYGRFKDGLSDTADFCARLLSPLLRRLQADKAFRANDPAIIELLSSAIGDGNKIAILDGHGTIGIANQHLGHWRDGVWYSNYDYIPIPKKKLVKKKEKIS